MTRDLFDIMGEGRGPRHVNGDDQVESVKLCDLDMVKHYETPDAVRVSLTGDDNDAEWLPKVHITINSHGKNSNAVKKDGQRIVLPVVTITMPVWLAREKGLV